MSADDPSAAGIARWDARFSIDRVVAAIFIQFADPPLRDAIFAGMRIEHLAEHDSVIHEGDGHSGMSALVDLVAVKA